jgi:uncharacterized membrane protein
LADHAFAAVGFVACLALAAVVWRWGPSGRIPTHFDLHGRVNGWMDRTQLATLEAVMAVVFAACYAGIGHFGGGTARNLKVGRLVIVLVALMTAAIMAGSAFGTLTGPDLGPSRLQPAALSLLFLVIGALIGKAGPNPFVGVRTYWALRSRLAWDKSNRLCGRLFFAIGVLGLIGSLLAPPSLVVFAVLAAVILASVAAVIESWRVWKDDPGRARS